MAKINDIAAQKQRKQKMILIVLGVVLLGVAVLQGPKLLGGSDAPPAAAPAGSTSAGTTVVPGSTTAGSATQTTAVPAGVPRAVLVGVPVGGGALLTPGEGQLRAFTLFTAKDPFIQTLPKEPTLATPAAPAAAAGGSGKGGSEAAGGEGGGSTAAPVPPGFATIAVNGDAEPLKVKQLFPEQEDVFVLVSLKGKTAKIAVSGGAFTEGQTITLKLGKNLTLVNTATGARYALKLLYVGDQPEEVEGFTQAPEPQK